MLGAITIMFENIDKKTRRQKSKQSRVPIYIIRNMAKQPQPPKHTHNQKKMLLKVESKLQRVVLVS
jgi:hypothetical protein